jgi:hypothetical protein
MRNIRGSLSEHVDEVVKKARREFDWRHYVAKHPWMSLGAAAAVGFFLVPRRACCKAGNSEAVNHAVDRVARAVQPSPFTGIVGGILSAVSSTLAREGVTFITSAVRQLLDRNGEPLEGNPGSRHSD